MRLLQPVKDSDWDTLLVSVPEVDGNIRLSGDYKVTVNPILKVDEYSQPKPPELLAKPTSGQKYTRLGLSAAYQQMLLDEDSSK